jgi:phosphohistidine phosphatase
MKKIVFVRHGRAEDSVNEISDFERSLTVKGKIISKQMARRFMEKENDPGLMITSPAFRALETAFIFAGEFGVKPDNIKVDSSLYYKSGMKALFDTLSKIDDGIGIITLFGHNPAFTEMPDRLCANGCEFVTKTSVVCISFKAERWSEIRPDSGKLEYFLKPEKEK